jgi:hypothetical protein
MNSLWDTTRIREQQDLTAQRNGLHANGRHESRGSTKSSQPQKSPGAQEDATNSESCGRNVWGDAAVSELRHSDAMG